ncbi:MAG: helix-turn-helix transcriptional regulator [Lachnospiraceae bacterium]|nr:helix-turn-helix transcriptional regulator [Lachnospiraceae bacterium]
MSTGTVREVLFGTAVRPVRLAELTRRTGIPERTLSRWRRDPTQMPFEGAVMIARALKLPDEEWAKLRR